MVDQLRPGDETTRHCGPTSQRDEQGERREDRRGMPQAFHLSPDQNSAIKTQ
jgi:hypothetical protein